MNTQWILTSSLNFGVHSGTNLHHSSPSRVSNQPKAIVEKEKEEVYDNKMVADPYLALGLSHDATQDQIKRAYRRLALRYHPDRLQRTSASQQELNEATASFATCSRAYTLLSDAQKKERYDHIYKFGGYDHITKPPSSSRNHPRSSPSPNDQENANPNKQTSSTTSQMGIGYTVIDPFSYIMSRGKVKTKAVAGVTIPSRFDMAHAATPGGGFRLSFSSGQIQESPSGTIEVTSKTTQFAHGKKFSKVETTTLHNDGRKETVIAGDDYVERRFSRSAPPKRKRRDSKDKDDLTHSTSSDDMPWYMSAWNGFRENALSLCSNPCSGPGSISVR